MSVFPLENEVLSPAPERAMELYNSDDYFNLIQQKIEQTISGDRIAISTMCIEPDEPITRGIVSAVKEAARRNVEVLFAIDALTLMGAQSIGPVYGPIILDKAGHSKRLDYIKELSATDNIDCAVINQPQKSFTNLFAGRCHLKPVIINDNVFIGGPNLEDTDRIDLVVGFEDKDTADWLYDTTRNLIQTGSSQAALAGEDQVRPLDEDNTILLDAGARDRSVILDEALALVDNAEEFVGLSSQYFPNGRLGKRLLQAYKQGIEVTVFYNHPSTHPNLNLLHKLILSRQRLTKPREFFQHQLPAGVALHTKAIVSDKAAIVGSHNFVDTGVQLGTAEIALHSTNPAFINAVHHMLRQQVAYFRQPDGQSINNVHPLHINGHHFSLEPAADLQA